MESPVTVYFQKLQTYKVGVYLSSAFRIARRLIEQESEHVS